MVRTVPGWGAVTGTNSPGDMGSYSYVQSWDGAVTGTNSPGMGAFTCTNSPGMGAVTGMNTPEDGAVIGTNSPGDGGSHWYEQSRGRGAVTGTNSPGDGAVNRTYNHGMEQLLVRSGVWGQSLVQSVLGRKQSLVRTVL